MNMMNAYGRTDVRTLRHNQVFTASWVTIFYVWMLRYKLTEDRKKAGTRSYVCRTSDKNIASFPRLDVSPSSGIYQVWFSILLKDSLMSKDDTF